jgi:hypothetical protein
MTSTVLESSPIAPPDWNRTGVDFRAPMPRPNIRGRVIDFHCHLFAVRHAPAWFAAADHYGIDLFVTMTPFEEVMGLQRLYGRRLRFIAIPKWMEVGPNWVDEWLHRVDMFYNIGSRILKFHFAPGTLAGRGWKIDDPRFHRIMDHATSRGMMIMSHVGDPDTWYHGKYAADVAKYGLREDHYRAWVDLLERYKEHTWIGAHLGGNPENFNRLQALLDRFPKLHLDCSATRWMVREISARREQAREFFIRNPDRILFGSDQVSNDARDYDFLASRFWCHRKLWETANIVPTPIRDPDLPDDQQPTLRGLALPDPVLQKLYHDNAYRLMAGVGDNLDE